ncbi:MAG TPA: sialidase family protein, partial [Gemmatimonadaceae bacterium]|nr:sialidase family protein [Gemmatimonadaceae bacterium]
MRSTLLVAAVIAAVGSPLAAQSTSSSPVVPALAGLAWRNVGPFRAGRVAAVSGVVGQAGVFYIGLPAGGVWKTTSAGQTWYPVFDSVKTVSSVGAIEVAPSEPNTIYAGMGDMITGNAINEGNGVWKSTDAGATWQHMGLDGTKQIPSIVVDPRDARVVMIAAQGDIHEKNDARGVFRSTDGGATWTRTLFVDDETGVQKLAHANDVPDVIFATTVHHYQARGASPRRFFDPDTGRSFTRIYKSTDNGVTWTEIPGNANGLPRLSGRTSIAVAMNTNAQRVYFIANSGLYRSDDGGGTWRRMAESDRRIANGQGGYNCGVYVDPRNPDVVYTFNTAAYKSTDGGNTFTGFRGAPGGDDPQQMWIDPTNGQRMLMGYDQGAIVSLDGGATWSSWYNQSTEQVYHIATDNSFPYWIYATQQDAGAVATRSRGNLGEITPLDWKPVPSWEWGTVVPDPANPDIVYGSGNGIVKITSPSELWIDVSPAADPAMKARVSSSQPLVWTRWQGSNELLAGMQYVMATRDGGAHWTRLSPDLTVTDAVAAALKRAAADTVKRGASGGQGTPRPPERRDTTPPPTGALESISASAVSAGVIWAGSNNGLLHVTRDHGATWKDVTPPSLPLPAIAGLVAVEASRHNPAEAYVAISYHTRGDYAPYIYRTRDYGQTWTKIVNGLPAALPSGAFVRVVREDAKRAGLLFAG